MSKVLREISTLRNKYESKYKYDFQKSLLSGALLPTGNIHMSAHTSRTVNLKGFTLAAATLTAMNSAHMSINVFSSCSQNHRMLKTKCKHFFWVLIKLSCTMCGYQGASHLSASILWLPKHTAYRMALSESIFLRNQNVTWAMTKWASSTKEYFFTAYVLGRFQSVSKTVCYMTIMAQVLATAYFEM